MSSNHGTNEEYLLEENQLPTMDNIALFEAALQGDYNRVKSLLQKGAKPNFFFRPEDQKNALHVAAERGHSVELIELLLKHGAVVNSIAAADQTTALILAAQNSHLHVVQTLLSHGARIDAANGYGNTALHEAAHAGSVPVMNCLIHAGAHLNIENHKGSTPLHLYCYGEDEHRHGLDGLRLLVDSGANIHATDHRDMTPLLVCCASGRGDFADYLLRHGASASVRDSEGRDAKTIANFYHKEGILKILNNHFHK